MFGSKLFQPVGALSLSFRMIESSNFNRPLGTTFSTCVFFLFLLT